MLDMLCKIHPRLNDGDPHFFFGSFAMKYLSHSSTVPGIETTKTFDKVSG